MTDMDKSQTSTVSHSNEHMDVTSNPKTPKLPSKIKNLTFIIGTIGVIPFFICALGIATHINQSPLLLKIILAYSTFIITFSSGIHWGIAVCQDTKFPKLSRLLIIDGIILALVAIAIFLFINLPWAQLLSFIGIFLIIWLIDLSVSIKRLFPLWFLGVRTLITVLVVGLLVLTYIQEQPKSVAQPNSPQPISTLPKKTG